MLFLYLVGVGTTVVHLPVHGVGRYLRPDRSNLSIFILVAGIENSL